jgi:hypothetical protein
MPNPKKPRASRVKDAQPPHRGHGSNHTATKRGSEVPQPPLRGPSIASTLHERFQQTGVRNSVDQMVQKSIAAQEEARRKSVDEAHQRRAREDASKTLSLSAHDRELISNMTIALKLCTEALQALVKIGDTQDDAGSVFISPDSNHAPKVQDEDAKL